MFAVIRALFPFVASFGGGLILIACSDTVKPGGKGLGDSGADAGFTIAGPLGSTTGTIGLPPGNPTGTGPGPGPTAQCVPPESPSQQCTACMTQNCCDTFVACDSDRDCVALQNCIDTCYNQSQTQQQFDACVQQCAQHSTQAAVGEYDAADRCVRQACGNLCTPTQ